jgi:hypothetical protein
MHRPCDGCRLQDPIPAADANCADTHSHPPNGVVHCHRVTGAVTTWAVRPSHQCWPDVQPEDASCAAAFSCNIGGADPFACGTLQSGHVCTGGSAAVTLISSGATAAACRTACAARGEPGCCSRARPTWHTLPSVCAWAAGGVRAVYAVVDGNIPDSYEAAACVAPAGADPCEAPERR